MVPEPKASIPMDSSPQAEPGPLMLLFTPGLVPGVASGPGDESPAEVERALAVLVRALGARTLEGAPAIGSVQVRIKAPGRVAWARPTLTWVDRVAELFAGLAHPPLLLIDDRVDVALARPAVVHGVHLGQGDLPLAEARALLGPDVLLGRSTHTFPQLLAADEEGADYLGFGPVFPTATKGYTEGLGPERAWIAAQATARPVFAIGGIGPDNVGELAEVGRAAVSSAVLTAEDPAAVATGLAEALRAD